MDWGYTHSLVPENPSICQSIFLAGRRVAPEVRLNEAGISENDQESPPDPPGPWVICSIGIPNASAFLANT